MIHRSLPYNPTPEDRLTRAKWARGVALFYGFALLLLLTFVAAHRIVSEPKGATSIIANARAAQVGARQPAARRNTDPRTTSIAPTDAPAGVTTQGDAMNVPAQRPSRAESR